MGPEITENIQNLILVIGHCVQSDISLQAEKNATYDSKIREDDVSEVFGDTIYEGYSDFTRQSKRTKIFGISMECLIPGTNLNRVYRIDVGSSRWFDQGYDLVRSVEGENRILYSKTPQILVIYEDNSINIIKSKMRNTRIHLPRENYEQHVSSIPELNIRTNPIQEHYNQKYLKYKNKYLQLKLKINSYKLWLHFFH